MNIKNRIKHELFGLSIPQEYVCLANDKLDEPLSLIWTTNGRSGGADITNNHVFLGYKPLIIALSFPSNSSNAEELNITTDIKIDFRSATDRDGVVARLNLNKIQQWKFSETAVFFFQGVAGEHHFISWFHQCTNRFKNIFSKRKDGNVELNGNLYDQVRIAYSVPRKICIITLSDGETMNMFPTDLHGFASEKIYLSSLRIGGKASQQVEKMRVLALSEIASSDYRHAYELGKNHMRDFNSIGSFSCLSKRSLKFDLPLPSSTLRYRELSLNRSFDIGVHRIHVYEIVHEDQINDGPVLTHIHQYYAQWRIDHRQSTEFLFR